MVTYIWTVKFGLCISPIPEEQWAATAQLLGTNSRLWASQGYRLQIDLTYMFWWWVKAENPGETHTNTGRTRKLHIEKALHQPGIEPRTCYEMTVPTTKPPRHPFKSATVHFGAAVVAIYVTTTNNMKTNVFVSKFPLMPLAPLWK